MIQTIFLDRRSPAKPALGAPCNGCGVCCTAEPCPLGQLRFLRRCGPCPALVWQTAAGRYTCGLVAEPRRWLPGLPARLYPALGRWLGRRIAAGRGCDSDAEVADVAEVE